MSKIMVRNSRWVFWILLTAVLFAGCNQQQEKKNLNRESNLLLLISFDGFRHDYLFKTETPHFDHLINNGVKSAGLIPVFPTKTFPNHYAIVTGLYPENNGIVSNNMIDPETGDRYRIGDRDAVENPNWYGGEPIWNTIEKQGKKAGTMFWVGSEAPIQNMRPTHWKKYDESIPDSSRVDTVVNWLSGHDAEQVDFASLYFSFTDTQGHRFGPESPEVIEAIRHADDLIGYLVKKLKENQLFEKTNIIIVSDHGMAEVSRDRIVVLNEMVNPDFLKIIDMGPLVMMNVKKGRFQEVYDSLKENQNHYEVFRKEEIPDRFHLKNHPRVPQLLIVPEIGYTVNTQEYFDANPGFPSGGTHGYDNNAEEMQTLFAAHGPDFKKGETVEPFQSVHIYELMCELLGIEPAPNDGSLDSLKYILR